MIPSLIIYTQFFSRIVIRKQVDISYVRKGVPYLPLFGCLMGLIDATFYQLIQFVFPDRIAWVLTLCFDVLLTGGFHLDGLADTADGLFSSRTKDRMLQIMKDSRIGSNGVLALIFYYALLIILFPYLQDRKWLVVLSLSMIGKVGLSLQLFRMTYARENGGSGNFFIGTKTQDILLAQILPIILSFIMFEWKGIIAYSFVIIFSIVYRWFVYGKIGGHTGDTLGAFVEVSQIIYLLGLII